MNALPGPGLVQTLGSRRAVLFAFALMGLLAAPGAAASDLEATRAAGKGGQFDAEGLFIVADGSQQAALGLDIRAIGGTWMVVDETVERTFHGPQGGEESVLSAGESRSVQDGSLGAADLFTTRVGETAKILVMPSGAGHQTKVQVEGQSFVQPGTSQVVERSHATTAFAPASGASTFIYYEYSHPDGLLISAEFATYQVQGDFDVYLWDVDFTVNGPDGLHALATGFTSTPRDDSLGLLSDEHYRYALLKIQGGELTLTVAGQGVSAASNHVAWTGPGTLTIEGASGTVATIAGRADVRGPVTLDSGSFGLTYIPGAVAVDVRVAPNSASGPYVRVDPKAEEMGAWVLPLALAGMAVVGLCASTYSLPTVVGARHLRRMEGLTGRPRPRGWRAARAEGYALQAAAAEDAGHARRAAMWMVLAARLDPQDPEKAMDAGIFLAARDRPGRALPYFHRAHAAFVEVGDAENMAHNAYEAAKSSARLQRTAAALDWLRIALQADPGLNLDVGSEPIFHALRNEPDYASITMGAMA